MPDFFSFTRYETTGGKKMQKRPIPFTDPYGSRYLYQMPQRCSVSAEILSFALRTEASPREKVDRSFTRVGFPSGFEESRKREKRWRINRRTTSERASVCRRSARIVDRRLTRSIVQIFNSSTIEIRRLRMNSEGRRKGEQEARKGRKKTLCDPSSLLLAPTLRVLIEIEGESFQCGVGHT